MLVFAQLVDLGANTTLFSAISAVADVMVAIIVVILLRPDPVLWRSLASVIVPIIAALLWASIPSFGHGPTPISATVGLANLAGAFACLVAGFAIGARMGLTRRFIDVIVVLGLAYIILSLGLRQEDPLHVWGYDKGLAQQRFTGTLLNPNAAACTFGVIAVLAVGRLQVAVRQSTGRGWPIPLLAMAMICVLTIALGLAACALTGSRASLVSSIVAVVALFAIPARRRLRSRGRVRRVIMAVAIALICAGFFAFLQAPVAGRFETFSIDAADRWMALTHHLALANRAPWFGYGLGSFPTVNAAHLTPANVDILWNFGAVHNIVVQTAFEAGWPFPCLMAVAVIAGIRILVRARKLDSADPLMLAQTFAVTLVFACACVDITLSIPALVALTAVLSGTVLGRADRARSSQVVV
ncbi:O-antigen ligase family protein [Sphingomonas sp. PP-CC-3A-396]|uniref:O-antigen ligase family protein n=1 Tax=Sphingomonas sp. PP-CC-3A-396 TaxID=2135655 RepID=UPI001404F9EE|nr:O-antigen ligase family protein [Sphingomonas sp. PP-CC-3A-396]